MWEKGTEVMAPENFISSTGKKMLELYATHPMAQVIGEDADGEKVLRGMAVVKPTPATHAILTQLKAGDTLPTT